jgi:hypothetical protein
VGGQGCLPGSAASCTALSSPESLNDVWVLWTTESPPRWELVAEDTGARPRRGRPPRWRGAAIANAATPPEVTRS